METPITKETLDKTVMYAKHTLQLLERAQKQLARENLNEELFRNHLYYNMATLNDFWEKIGNKNPNDKEW